MSADIKIRICQCIGDIFYSNKDGLIAKDFIVSRIAVMIDEESEIHHYWYAKDTNDAELEFCQSEMFKTREDAVADLVKNIDGLDIEKVISKLGVPIVGVGYSDASITVDENSKTISSVTYLGSDSSCSMEVIEYAGKLLKKGNEYACVYQYDNYVVLKDFLHLQFDMNLFSHTVITQ